MHLYILVLNHCEIVGGLFTCYFPLPVHCCTQLFINLNSISGPLTLHWHSMGNDFENFFFENKQTILRHGVVLALLYGTRACRIWLLVVPIYRARTTPCRNIVWLFWESTLYWHSINIQYKLNRQSIYTQLDLNLHSISSQLTILWHSMRYTFL